jgi:lipoate-protein ligase A
VEHNPLAHVRSVRLLFDPPGDGVWNMAADEVLLEDAASGVCTLRFYAWREATVSLGYFQRVEQRDTHAASLACPLVRRASGGGALLHDRPACDLTYSVAVPDVPRTQAAQRALYELFHESLIEVLSERRVAARLCGQAEAMERPGAFLCFQRHTDGDVLLETSKILGSAQRRSNRGLLQHGSVLLQMSAAAPELPGIRELTGQQIDAAWLMPRWLDALERRSRVDWLHASWSDAARDRIDAVASDKFGNPAWTARR